MILRKIDSFFKSVRLIGQKTSLSLFMLKNRYQGHSEWPFPGTFFIFGNVIKTVHQVSCLQNMTAMTLEGKDKDRTRFSLITSIRSTAKRSIS